MDGDNVLSRLGNLVDFELVKFWKVSFVEYVLDDFVCIVGIFFLFFNII